MLIGLHCGTSRQVGGAVSTISLISTCSFSTSAAAASLPVNSAGFRADPGSAA